MFKDSFSQGEMIRCPPPQVSQPGLTVPGFANNLKKKLKFFFETFFENYIENYFDSDFIFEFFIYSTKLEIMHFEISF